MAESELGSSINSTGIEFTLFIIHRIIIICTHIIYRVTRQGKPFGGPQAHD